MSTNHTPGPWKIDEAEYLDLAVIRDDEDGEGICEMGARTVTNKANARLIAAAPDLLFACKEIVGEYEEKNRKIEDANPKALVEGLLFAETAAVVFARDAIAKAEGRDP